MLGARIAALRRREKLSQAELARRVKVSPSAMGMYEQGRREPSGETLVAIARELKVTTDYLLTGQTEVCSPDFCRMLQDRLCSAEKHLLQRPERPFTREELTVLLAAMLMEP